MKIDITMDIQIDSMDELTQLLSLIQLPTKESNVTYGKFIEDTPPLKMQHLTPTVFRPEPVPNTKTEEQQEQPKPEPDLTIVPNLRYSGTKVLDVMLHSMNDNEGITIQEIVERMHKTEGAVSSAMAKLLNKGCVQRHRAEGSFVGQAPFLYQVTNFGRKTYEQNKSKLKKEENF